MMGWWDAGDDDTLGDGPADVLMDALKDVLTWQRSQGLPPLRPAALRHAVVEALHRIPDHLEPGSGEPEAEVEAALAHLLPPGADRRIVAKDEVIDTFRAAFEAIAQEYLDSEMERKPRVRELTKALSFVLDKPGRYLAMPRAYPIEHPLLDRPRPTLAEVLERATPEARALLEAASTLAGHRVRAEEKLRTDAAALVTDPWVGPPFALPEREPFLGRADLLRALMVRAPELMRSPLLGDIALTEKFEQDRATWEEVLSTAAPPPPLELESTWRLRWSMGLLSGEALNVPWLFGALDDACLEALLFYSRAYIDGEVSLDDELSRIRTNQVALAGWGRKVPPAQLVGRGPLLVEKEASSPYDRPVLAIADDELVALWLCQRPQTEDEAGQRFTLVDLLRRLEMADERLRHQLDWRRLVRRTERQPWGPLNLEWPKLLQAQAQGRVEAFLERAHAFKRSEFFGRYLHSPEQIKALVELEAQLP